MDFNCRMAKVVILCSVLFIKTMSVRPGTGQWRLRMEKRFSTRDLGYSRMLCFVLFFLICSLEWYPNLILNWEKSSFQYADSRQQAERGVGLGRTHPGDG